MNHRYLKSIVAFSFSIAGFSSVIRADDVNYNQHLVFGAYGGGTYSKITKDAFNWAPSYVIGGDARLYIVEALGVGAGLEFDARKLGTQSGSYYGDDTAYFMDFPIFVASRFGTGPAKGLIDLGAEVAIPLDDSVGGRGPGLPYLQPQTKIGPFVRVGYLYRTANALGFGLDFTAKYFPDGLFQSNILGLTSDTHFSDVSFGLNLRMSYALL